MKNCGMRIAKCGMAAMMIAIAACTRISNNGSKSDAGVTLKKGDPWPAAGGDLARQPDTVTARRVLNQLNGDLEANNQPLPAMAAEESGKLGEQLHPSPGETKDWAAKSFTLMDANYLGECLFFIAVVRSLDVDGLKPEQQAKAAFDWTCRQIYLRPATMNGPRGPVNLPPQEALRRGYGSGFERESAFLALARQLGLDAVLIGPPGCEVKRRSEAKSDNAIWAVGIRDGGDVILFSPWFDEPLPGAAKLSAAKANAAAVANWINAKNASFNLTAKDIESSVAYSTAPLNAVTPRMKLLESKLAAEVNVKLAAKLVPPVYAPPVEVDPYALPHVLGSFTPKDDGGYDPTPTGPMQLAFMVNFSEAVAAVRLLTPEELTIKQARAHFLERCAGTYKAQFLDSGFRERLQRGQFNEVVRQLVEMDRQYSLLRESRRDSDLAKALQRWYKDAAVAYENLQLTNLPEKAFEKPEAEAKVQALWDKNSPIQAAVQMAVADIGTHEAAYLLALCKHEQAERSQTRWRKTGTDAAAGKAADDWAVAKDAWARYQDTDKRFESVHPGRGAHAAKLAERAAALAANPKQEAR